MTEASLWPSSLSPELLTVNASKMPALGETFNMAEEIDVEITFLPTNTSEIHLHAEQLLQNTY